MHVGARGQPRMTLASQNPHDFLRQGLLLAWNPPSRLDRLASDPQGFSCRYLSGAKSTST